MTESGKRESRMLKRMTSMKTTAGDIGRFAAEISEDSDLSAMTEEQKDRIRILSDSDLLDDPDNDLIYGQEPDDELVDAMRKYGFQGVILAWPAGNGKYVIEAGHRRRAAARKAGLKELRVYETKPPKSDAERRMRLLMSNLHSRKQSPMRLARIAQNLYETHALMIEEKKRNGTLQEGETTALNQLVAEDMELNDSTVERYRALLKLIPPLQEAADSGECPWSDLASAAALDRERQEELAYKISERARRWGSEAVSRKWLRAEIKAIKTEAAGIAAPKTTKSSSAVKKTVTAKALVKNVGTISDMLSSEVKVNPEEVPGLVSALEAAEESIRKKLNELKRKKA